MVSPSACAVLGESATTAIALTSIERTRRPKTRLPKRGVRRGSSGNMTRDEGSSTRRRLGVLIEAGRDTKFKHMQLILCPLKIAVKRRFRAEISGEATGIVGRSQLAFPQQRPRDAQIQRCCTSSWPYRELSRCKAFRIGCPTALNSYKSNGGYSGSKPGAQTSPELTSAAMTMTMFRTT